VLASRLVYIQSLRHRRHDNHKGADAGCDSTMFPHTISYGYFDFILHRDASPHQSLEQPAYLVDFFSAREAAGQDEAISDR
jgi:hypothetical protein